MPASVGVISSDRSHSRVHNSSDSLSRVAVEMRDNVDEFAAPHGVVHDMAMRAHPHRAFRDGNVARHRGGRRHATPADAAGEPWRVAPNRLFRTTE